MSHTTFTTASRRSALALAASALFLQLTPSHAATISVTGSCTLPNAIRNANSDTNGGGNGCAAGSGADTLQLAPGATYTLTSALSAITTPVLIEGNLATLQIQLPSGSLTVPLLDVRMGGSLEIRNLTLQGHPSNRRPAIVSTDAPVTLRNTTVKNFLVAGENDAATITVARGALTIRDSWILDNANDGAVATGGVAHFYGPLTISNTTFARNAGTNGGLNAQGSNMVVINSRFEDNKSSRPYGMPQGGGIAISGATSAILSGVSFTGNVTGYGGGAVMAYHGVTSMSFQNCTFFNNQAAFGGAIWSVADEARLTVDTSRFYGNTAVESGGAIKAPKVQVTRSEFSGNTAKHGGALHVRSGLVADTSFTANSASQHGVALYQEGQSSSDLLTLRGVTMSDNTAPSAGPGVITGRGLLELVNSTISQNNSRGVSYSFFGGTSKITNTTVVRNKGALSIGAYNGSSSARVELSNVLVSGNPTNTFSYGAEIKVSAPLAVASVRPNLFGENSVPTEVVISGFTPAATDFVATKDGNLPTSLSAIVAAGVQDNGGPTPTLALVAGSPAVDKGAGGTGTGTVACPTSTDQTGKLRPQEQECDIGAFEFMANPPVATMALSATTVMENVGTYTARVNLSKSSPTDVVVPLSYTGTATRNTDYTAPASVTIPAGALYKDFAVLVTNDALDENNETVVINLGKPANAALGTAKQLTLTVNDDDAAPSVRFASTATTVAETVGTAKVRVSLSAVSGRPVGAQVTYSGSTAIAGQDFTGVSSITIPAGATYVDIPLTIVKDGRAESAEQIQMTLSSPTSAVLGSPASTVVTISANST